MIGFRLNNNKRGKSHKELTLIYFVWLLNKVVQNYLFMIILK